MKPALTLLLGVLAILPVRGHFVATPFPKIVQPGIPVRALTSTDPHAFVVYKVMVPEDTARMTVTTSGGAGHVDVFVRRNVYPSYNGAETDYASRYPGTRQQIRIANPEAGAWYIGLQADGGYLGMQLGVSMTRVKGAIAQPTFTPAPGIYPAALTTKIKAKGKKSALRYTTDGEDPDTGSPMAEGPITIAADSTLKARLYNAAGEEGPIGEAVYQIRPPGDVIDLINTRSISHLAALKGGRHVFRMNVEAGQRLSVYTEGGVGKSLISVQHGSIPPVGKPSKKSPIPRHANRIVIPETVEGEYYITVDATGNFSGRTLLASVAGDGPDLMPWADALRPYVSTEEFAEASCEVQEGLIGAGMRRLLRYSTEVRNIGSQDMVIPDPEGNPLFEYHACHGHYHFKHFAGSRLLDLEGNELLVSRKVSFCLLDNIRWDRGAVNKRRFTCSNQGIQAGWGDVYDSGLPGQWIEIGDLPAGDYQLELTVNPDGVLPEFNQDNNMVRIPVTIPEG